MQSKKYPPPDFVLVLTDIATYEKWLEKRANEVRQRDVKRGKPFALNGSVEMYKECIHAAVCACGGCDPYTGERLRWDLIGTWYSGKEKILFAKKYYLLPTVDHIDPDAGELRLEICSWLINTSKNLLAPADFVEMCRNVSAHEKVLLIQSGKVTMPF
jgi:hypothetical protein